MIADRARAMMAAGKVIPELEVRGAFSGEWRDLPLRRISFHFFTERREEALSYGAFCMKCGRAPVVRGVLDFYPWHLLGLTAFFYTAEKEGGAGLWFYDIGFRCDMVYLEPVPDTEVMVLTVRKNRKDCNPDEDVCPVKFRCLVERERFFHDFRKALSQKVSDPSLQKWMVPRVNRVLAMGMDREEKLARVRKAEERVAGREPHGKDSGKVEWYEVKIKREEMEYLAAVLREVNMIRQDPWAMGEPLPERKLEEFVE